MKLILSGFFIHLILMGAIFDIYFKSPIIQGLKSQENYKIPPAKRLILIVADGLRAESLFGTNLTLPDNIPTVASYLRSKIISSQAAWGISHTRVPTESRPGHVALIAGIYEDPSAVARGWKENPVEFDSVFNQSFHTWAWGSPDIITMFNKLNHFHGYSYSPEEEDFSGKTSTILLDTWVFDRVELFFQNIQENEFRNLVENGKVIYFLHLLGLDTAGHTHKPKSNLHTENIRIVDKRIKIVENYVNEYYADNDTVFIFTSDHGMTDWGSHGAGSVHETETPFIAWGAGIKPSKVPINIAQADIAPLISALIGISIPVNSIGLLPTQILNLNKEHLAHAFFLNAKQIYAQFEEKRYRTETNSIPLFYKPYEELSVQQFKNVISTINQSLKDGEYDYVMKSCESLIKASLRGLDYYQNYHQQLLLTCIAIAYFGWIFYVIIYLTEPSETAFIPHVLPTGYGNNYVRHFELYTALHTITAIVVIIIWIVIFVESLPFMYYIYCTLPIYIWWRILNKTHSWIPRFLNILNSENKIFILSVVYLIGIETLVVSFFHRQALSLTLIVVGFWPYYLRKIHFKLKYAWTLSCFILAVFPFLPVVGSTFNLYFIAFTAVLWILANFGSLFFSYFMVASSNFFIDKWQMYIAIIQSLFLACAVYNLQAIDQNIKNNMGLTSINQFTSWFLSGTSLMVEFFGSIMIVPRLVNITMSFLIPFILLSVSYEPLFLLILFVNLMLWLSMEHIEFSPICRDLSLVRFTKIAFNRHKTYEIYGEDFRRGFFILLYVILGFFGMGNMASINSFDPMWVRNFVTVFSPFTMTALILFKTIIPYLVISCVFRAVTVCLQAPVKKLFFVVLVFCDLMGVHFLFMVKNTGSWLEIGSSISHYVIVQVMVLFLLLLYIVATALTDFNFSKHRITVPMYPYKVHRR